MGLTERAAWPTIRAMHEVIFDTNATIAVALGLRGLNLSDIAKVTGVSREYVRQVEASALKKIRARAAELGWDEKDIRSDEELRRLFL